MADNRIVLYDWILTWLFPRMKDDGMWAGPDPAPLPADQIVVVFEEVANSKGYYRQHLELYSKDGERVVLQNGVVSVL